MYQETTKVITGDGGALRGVEHNIKTTNLSQRQFVDMLKRMPRDQRLKFNKNCRLKAIIPVYLPEGDFSPDKTALNLDSDQLHWFMKRRKSFVVED